MRRDLLRHLGVRPGEQIDVRPLPGGQIEVRASGPAGQIDGFIGLLADHTSHVASLSEISQAAEEGWAGE